MWHVVALPTDRDHDDSATEEYHEVETRRWPASAGSCQRLVDLFGGDIAKTADFLGARVETIRRILEDEDGDAGTGRGW